MVMDDILVNFDSRRARAAAELLVEFSRNGYQLLMFTCHEHMVQLFHSLHVDVKVLPHHKEVVESNAAPTDYRSSVYGVDDHSDDIPVRTEYQAAMSSLQLGADDYDPELEFELSAVVDDQHKDLQLRHELVYVSPDQKSVIDLSAESDIWTQASTAGG